MIRKKETAIYYPDILKAARDILPWLTEVRRDLHAHPETAMEEARTRDRICTCLDEMNIPCRVLAETGVFGHIPPPNPDKTIALRADIDALPMADRKTVPYKSFYEGKMHACGHDMHTAILLGTAKLLSRFKGVLPHNVILLFQPAEETCTGAKAMIKAGALTHPKPDAIFALHAAPGLKTGQIGIKYNTYAASSDAVDILINGTSCHGARPFQGTDAIIIAAQTITAIQTIISRNINAHDKAVLSLGRIQGGNKRNIIAEKVNIEGTLRTLSEPVRTKILGQLRELVTTLPQAFGGTGKLTVRPGAPILKNDTPMIDHVRQNAGRLLGNEAVIRINHPSMGVEDFAFYLKEIPGAIYSLGTRGPDSRTAFPIHTNQFDIDETAMPIGVALQVMNVLTF